MALVKFCKCLPQIFSGTSYPFRYIKILNFLSAQSRPRSQSAIFAITSLDDKCQNLQTLPFTFFLFSLRYDLCERHTHTQTDTHIHTETNKPMTIGEILQICQKTVEILFRLYNASQMNSTSLIKIFSRHN